MVSLASRALAEGLESVHVQVNPYNAYSKPLILANARRLVLLLRQHEEFGDSRSRVCIKIPSTWEGLQACRELQRAGVATLATTLFTQEQAILAGEVGCAYIAPYVNDLRTQTNKGYDMLSHALDRLTHSWA